MVILSTAQSQLIPAIKALGIDPRDALRAGEVDPAVYLLQEAGAQFGYRFEWERYGPFSEALAVDIGELTADDLETAVDPRDLPNDVASAAERVRVLIEPPRPAGLPEFTWIRLLASVHFLRRYAGVEVDNGDRPPYLQQPPFEQNTVALAVERVRSIEVPA